jgi:pimeloyl-ACP methyl ester carboxylesterase
MLMELPRPPSPVAGASSPSTHSRGAGPRPGNERDRLGLRFISVERNGFGATPFHPALGFPEAVDDVLAVLATLGVQRFSVVAISGGGPYAARLLARVPERVASVHLAAATSGGALVTHGAAAGLLGDIEAVVNDPAAFWEYPPDSPVHAIPGFMDAARHEGRRALAEPTRAAAALRHEIALLGSEDLPVLRGLPAPAFLYWGADDALVPIVHARAWQASLGVVAATRIYPGEGHDVQYVHWPEILGDIAAAVR